MTITPSATSSAVRTVTRRSADQTDHADHLDHFDQTDETEHATTTDGIGDRGGGVGGVGGGRGRVSWGLRSWPSSPLDAAERAFDLLIEPPTPVAFDGRGLSGLPDRIVGLEELRRLLLTRTTSVEVRDAAWRHLVVRARRDGPAWVVAAVGVAIPGLRRLAGVLSPGWIGDRDDLDAELLLGFVERLRTLDVDAPRVCGRLLDAGLRAARRAQARESRAHRPPGEAFGPIAPIRPWDHPELVLARAVSAGVIDREEAHLIAATRLGDDTLAQAGAALGIPRPTAGQWRARAEQRLVQAITDGDLAVIPLRPRRAHPPHQPDQPDQPDRPREIHA